METFGRIVERHKGDAVNGFPITRADYLWVLHRPDLKVSAMGERLLCCSQIVP